MVDDDGGEVAVGGLEDFEGDGDAVAVPIGTDFVGVVLVDRDREGEGVVGVDGAGVAQGVEGGALEAADEDDDAISGAASSAPGRSRRSIVIGSRGRVSDLGSTGVSDSRRSW